jgi:hypothetical protein
VRRDQLVVVSGVNIYRLPCLVDDQIKQIIVLNESIGNLKNQVMKLENQKRLLIKQVKDGK